MVYGNYLCGPLLDFDTHCRQPGPFIGVQEKNCLRLIQQLLRFGCAQALEIIDQPLRVHEPQNLRQRVRVENHRLFAHLFQGVV